MPWIIGNYWRFIGRIIDYWNLIKVFNMIKILWMLNILSYVLIYQTIMLLFGHLGWRHLVLCQIFICSPSLGNCYFPNLIIWFEWRLLNNPIICWWVCGSVQASQMLSLGSLWIGDLIGYREVTRWAESCKPGRFQFMENRTRLKKVDTNSLLMT